MADIDVASYCDKRDGVVPENIQQLADMYDGADQDSYQVADQSSDKTAVNTAQATVVDSFETANDTLITTAKSAKDTTVNDFETANDTLIGTAKTNIDTLLTALKNGWPFADEATFDGVVDTLNTDIDSEIDTTIAPDYTTLKSDLATDIDTVAPDYTTLKTNLATEVNSGIDSTVSVNQHEVFENAKTEVVAQIALIQSGGTDKFPHSCPRCKGEGYYAASNDNENVTTRKKCESCDGLGRTQTLNTSYNGVWSVNYSRPRE